MMSSVIDYVPSSVLEGGPNLNLDLKGVPVDRPDEGGYVVGRVSGGLWEGEWEGYERGHMIVGRFEEIKGRVVKGDVELCP